MGYIAPNGNSVEPTVNTTAENEHVNEAERKIRTVKEGAWSMRATILMFWKIPRMLVILLIGAVLFWLNCIPTKFSNYSSARIIKDRVIDYKIHCKHQFGEFVQVVTKTTNLIEVPRTIACIHIPQATNRELGDISILSRASLSATRRQRTYRYLWIFLIKSMS